MCGERARTRRNEQKRDETTFVGCSRGVMIVLALQLLSDAALKAPQPLPRPPPPPPTPSQDLRPCPPSQGDGGVLGFLTGCNAVGTPTPLLPTPSRGG